MLQTYVPKELILHILTINSDITEQPFRLLQTCNLYYSVTDEYFKRICSLDETNENTTENTTSTVYIIDTKSFIHCLLRNMDNRSIDTLYSCFTKHEMSGSIMPTVDTHIDAFIMQYKQRVQNFANSIGVGNTIDKLGKIKYVMSIVYVLETVLHTSSPMTNAVIRKLNKRNLVKCIYEISGLHMITKFIFTLSPQQTGDKDYKDQISNIIMDYLVICINKFNSIIKCDATWAKSSETMNHCNISAVYTNCINEHSHIKTIFPVRSIDII